MKHTTHVLVLGLLLAAVVMSSAFWWPGLVHRSPKPSPAPPLLAFAPSPSLQPEQVSLSVGCNNIALTWPAGTPMRAVAIAVSPPADLIAIWRQIPAAGRFSGYSPLRAAPLDYTSVTTRLEPVMICVKSPSSLRRPPLTAQDWPVEERFDTLPPGWALPSSEECAARVRRSPWEPRPENTYANGAWGVAGAFLPPWANNDVQANEYMRPRIDGAFSGTTDEILQWGACKWGLDEDVVRAMAVQESRWRQSMTGDPTSDAGRCQAIGLSVPCHQSYGLLQVKTTIHPGTWPYARDSTAFNVDYALAVLRNCFEGYELWLGQRIPLAGYSSYQAGDLWGCLGRWFSGGWHDQSAVDYIAKVRRHFDERTWTSAGF
jgi:autotransporter family porin